MKIKPGDKDICPMLQCVCIEAQCKFWTHIRGKRPDNGADMDMYDCSMKWLPVLMIENSKASAGVQAAVESFRNTTVKQGEQALRLEQQRIGYHEHRQGPTINAVNSDISS